MKEHQYALVDRAILPNILEQVEHYDTQAWCLFPAPVDEEFACVAPYLVQLTPELNEYLSQLASPWGFSLTTSAEKKVLLLHLRNMLSVCIEGREAPIYFRYYDPRLLWSIVSCLTPSQQIFFAGPISQIQTYVPEQKEGSFESYPPMHQPPKYLTLNHDQYSVILAQCQQNLEQEVASLFYAHQPLERKDTAASQEMAKHLVQHLSNWGISIASDIKSVAQHCLDHQVNDWSQVPELWKNVLSDQQNSAPYRVKALTNNKGGSHEL